MENASKALLIASGILIGILLMSLFAYLVTQMTESAERINAIMQENKITKFNQQFLNFEGRGTNIKEFRKDSTDSTIIDTKYNVLQTEVNEIYNNPLTAQDVVTIINLANDSNELTEWPVIIEVYLNGTKINNVDTNIFLMQNMETKYKCSSIETDVSTKTVKNIMIETIPIH